MIIRDKNGNEHIAMTPDFLDVTITFTPAKWGFGNNTMG